MTHLTRNGERDRDAVAQRLYAATKDPLAAQSITYTNATTTGFYTGNLMSSTRPGANDQYESRAESAMLKIRKP